MISAIVGNILKQNTKTRIWWAKLAMALILSNVFFFVLFKNGNETTETNSPLTDGQVEVQIKAQLLTPFQTGKKIILLNRARGKKLEGMLVAEMPEEEKLIIRVKETEASTLFDHSTWEILPYLKNLRLHLPHKGEGHEIRY